MKDYYYEEFPERLERDRLCIHEYGWHETLQDGGFAQCRKCHLVDTSVKEENCVTAKEKEETIIKTKNKKVKDLETRKAATIAYLKGKGLPYHE